MDMAGVKNRSCECPRAVAKGDGCSWPTSAAALPFLLPTVPRGSEGRSHGFRGGIPWGRQQVQREREEPRLGWTVGGLWVGTQVSRGLSAGGLGHWEGLSWEGPVRTGNL